MVAVRYQREFGVPTGASDKCFAGTDVIGLSITAQEQHGASHLRRELQDVRAVIEIIEERLCADDPPPTRDLHQIVAPADRNQFSSAHTEFFKMLTGHQ